MRFKSSIPARATPRVVALYPSGTPERVEFRIGKSVVGYRLFDENGALSLDFGMRKGRRHGTEYRFDIPGKLLSATPYRNGVEHGLARQWSDDGRLIGSYRMRHGTGVDLWWSETWTRPRRIYLAEVRHVVKGLRHGYEWWLNEDQKSVWEERHWWKGKQHGIEREWDRKGRLRRGFPKFHVSGRTVTRRTYERACAKDSSLPPYRSAEDRPARTFPRRIASHRR